MSFYVTTPIYYVNAQPHLGHAYTTIAADILARHKRQRGEDVFFLTGTDEHGEPIADAAHAQGVSPQELADRYAERFKALLPQLEASNDFFIRTTDPEHERRVQEVLVRVHENGHTYKGLYEGWYCPRCADFKVENEILEGNRCPIHEIVLERHQEENWFFRLSTFQEPLERLYAEQRDFVMPQRHYNEALSFITSGLQDISLSRERLKWGVPVPWDPGHVFYVWFDALLNYYTALGYARNGDDLTSRYWPATFHLVGKDILKFHTVFWPAMLMAADLPVPQHVFVHGFLLGADGRKMSKSLGNVLDPFEVMAAFGADALRFYLVRDVSFGADGSVGMDAVRARYEAELANEYGNLASRTVAMIHRYRDGDRPRRRARPRAGRRVRGIAGTRFRSPGSVRCDERAGRDLAARAPLQPLRRRTCSVAAGARSRTVRRARNDARDARRGVAGADRAAASVHPGQHRPAARRAVGARARVRPGRAGLARRRPHDRDARAAVSQARVTGGLA